MTKTGGVSKLFVFGLFCIGLTPSTQAQQTGERGMALEEVIVTAQKREESIQEIPLAVTALSSQDIEDNFFINMQDIKNIVPNLYLEEALSAATTPKAFIRGIGVDNQVFSFDTPIGFYVDGVYFARVTGALVDLFDIERIEVLRGPQGTLYGRNSSVGAIRVITQDPNLQDVEFVMDATTGSKNRANGRVTVNIPLHEDKAALRMSMATRNADGWQTDLTTGQEYQAEDIVAGRANFLVTPTEDLRLFLRADFLEDDSDVRQGSNFFLNPDNDIYTFESSPGTPFVNSVDTLGTSFTVEWGRDNWDLTSITAYRELTYRNANDVDGRADVMSFQVDQQDLDEWQISQEVFLTGGDTLQWVAGLFLFHEENEFTWALRIFSDPTIQFFDQETDTTAAYGQLTWPITDQLSLTGGLRFTTEEKAMDAIQFFPDGTRNPDFQFVDKLEADEVTWRAALDYQASDDTLFYGSVATGFRSGGFNGSARDQASILSGSFGTEESFTAEGGTKLDLLNGLLRLNAAYFWAEYTDLQLAITRSDGTITTANVEATVQGLELELTARPTDNFDVSLTLGTMDDDIKDSDLELKNTPDYQYRIGTQYRIPLQTGSQIRLGADYSNIDDSFNDTSNRPFTNTGSYGLLNARVGWEGADEHWAVTLAGMNLTDEFVNIHTFNIADGFISSVHFTNTPRHWALNVRYRY